MRVEYWSLPPEVRAAAASRSGAPAVSAEDRAGGFSGGVAARLALADGRRVFLKGCPEDHPVAAQYDVEAWFGARMPDTFPAPRLLASFDAAGWFVLLFEDVFADLPGGEADLTDPADLAACRNLLTRLASAEYPAAWSARIPPVGVALGHLASGWARVAAEPPAGLDPWAAGRLGELRAMERHWASAAEGEGPLHTDLHPGNVLVRGRASREAVAVDWTRPARGAAWVDALLFCLRDPGVTALPEWLLSDYDVPHEALCGLLSGAAGHWTDAARSAAPPYAPGLRAYEAARAAKALVWLRRAREDDGS